MKFQGTWNDNTTGQQNDDKLMRLCLKDKSDWSQREPIVYSGNGDYKLTHVKI